MSSTTATPRVRMPLITIGMVFASLALALLLAGPTVPAQTARAQDEPREHLQQLPGVNGFEGYGRVKFIDEGDRTRVIVAIHDVPEGQFIPAIHSGTCATYSGIPDFPLAPFPFDDRSRTTVDIPFDEILSGGYLVDIHPASATTDELFDPQVAVVCGDIEAAPVVEAEPTIAPIDDPDELVITSGPVTGIGPVDSRYWSTISVAVLAALAFCFAAAGLDLRRRSLVTVAQRRLYRLTGREL